MTTQTPDAVREAEIAAMARDLIPSYEDRGNGYDKTLAVLRYVAALDSRAGDAGEGFGAVLERWDSVIPLSHDERAKLIAELTAATPAPAVDARELVQRFRDASRGLGRAGTTEWPGGPYMSMADAAAVYADLMQGGTGRGVIADDAEQFAENAKSAGAREVDALIQWARGQMALPDGSGYLGGHIDEHHRYKLRELVNAIDSAQPAFKEDADEFATVAECEHDEQRELSRLYNHKAHDGPQFNRIQMRVAIRHGKRLAAPAVDAVPAGEVVERLREALTPSAATKAAYHGEFTFDVCEGVSDAGIELYRKVYVPWETVKQIMSAISARAALSHGGGRK
jgi:hypothetical protein